MGEAAIWCEIGNLYMLISGYDAAIYAFEKAMAYEAENPRILDALALACYKKGRFEEAQGLFEKAMQLSEDDAEKAEILRHLGDLHVGLRKYRRAAMVYETADLFSSPATPLDTDSTPPPARPPLVTLPPQPPTPAQLDSDGDADGSGASPGSLPPAGTSKNGRSAQTFSLKGIAAASSTIHPMSVTDPSPETNQPDPRMEALAALVPPPADPESGIDGGTEMPPLDRQGPDTAEQVTPLHQQREPREIEVYRMVTQANPANDRAWFTLGNNLKNHGRIVESIEAYETALALNPRADAYHFELAAAYASVREYQKAIQEFQEVIQLAPDNHFAHAALAACYRRLGESEEARKHTELVVARMQQESNYNRACFESIRGNQERAIDLLRAATAEDGVTLDMLENDSDLDFIRETTAFRSLVAVLAPQAVIVAASGKESR